jgi:hypothetical protein
LPVARLPKVSQMQHRQFSASALDLQIAPSLTYRFCEMIADDGGSHQTFRDCPAPDLRWRCCPDCGSWFLRFAQRLDGQLWIETLEPAQPWIRLAVKAEYFQMMTRIARPHRCRPEIAIEELAP